VSLGNTLKHESAGSLSESAILSYRGKQREFEQQVTKEGEEGRADELATKSPLTLTLTGNYLLDDKSQL
jgi:hypothetical protein